MTHHGLWHSYAVVSLESGDDIKTVQTNHATANFTLDVYGPRKCASSPRTG